METMIDARMAVEENHERNVAKNELGLVLEELKGSCPVCWACSRVISVDGAEWHHFSKCTNFEMEDWRIGRFENMGWVDKSCCFFCGVPSGVGLHEKSSRREDQSNCKYKDCIKPVLHACWFMIHDWAADNIGMKGFDVVDYKRWLKELDPVTGFSNAVMMLIRLSKMPV
jgi:hypothetical protein